MSNERMTKTTWLLLIVLVTSNAVWAYRALDQGVSDSYHRQVLAEHRGALAQALVVIAESGRDSATRASVLAVADRAARVRGDHFEADGYVWVGDLGLKFDPEGTVVEAIPAWTVEGKAP